MSDKPTLSNLLISAGYTPRVAKALAWLIPKGEGIVTSREIERGADLRQPEVHYAIRILTGSGWIEVIETPATSKPGRPFIQYKFLMNQDRAYAEVMKIVSKKSEQLQNMAEQIKEEIYARPENKQEPKEAL
jgi:predicted transcriptional regulator